MLHSSKEVIDTAMNEFDNQRLMRELLYQEQLLKYIKECQMLSENA